MYSIGLEQEFFVVDSKSHEIVFLAAKDIKKIFGNTVKQEAFSCQIEINSPVCNDIKQLEVEYQGIIDQVHECADKHGYWILKASTFPLPWDNIQLTDNLRYKRISKYLGHLIDFFLCCSLQFHVNPQHPKNRFPLINYLRTYLPYLLALTTSSPFWNGQRTGLMSYRAMSIQAIPHQGLPPDFGSETDFKYYIKRIKKIGVIQSVSEIWWDLRPHSFYPTLECRICDNVQESKDVIAIAALYQALVVKCEQSLIRGARLHPIDYLIDLENKYQAAIYGMDGKFLIHDDKEAIPIKDAIKVMLSSLEETMFFLGTSDRIEDIFNIMHRGTSALEQIKIYEEFGNLKSVVEWLGKT